MWTIRTLTTTLHVMSTQLTDHQTANGSQREVTVTSEDVQKRQLCCILSGLSKASEATTTEARFSLDSAFSSARPPTFLSPCPFIVVATSRHWWFAPALLAFARGFFSTQDLALPLTWRMTHRTSFHRSVKQTNDLNKVRHKEATKTQCVCLFLLTWANLSSKWWITRGHSEPLTMFVRNCYPIYSLLIFNCIVFTVFIAVVICNEFRSLLLLLVLLSSYLWP